jgi:hypothetical protein
MHFATEMVFKYHDTKYLLAKNIYKKTNDGWQLILQGKGLGFKVEPYKMGV